MSESSHLLGVPPGFDLVSEAGLGDDLEGALTTAQDL